MIHKRSPFDSWCSSGKIFYFENISLFFFELQKRIFQKKNFLGHEVWEISFVTEKFTDLCWCLWVIRIPLFSFILPFLKNNIKRIFFWKISRLVLINKTQFFFSFSIQKKFIFMGLAQSKFEKFPDFIYFWREEF